MQVDATETNVSQPMELIDEITLNDQQPSSATEKSVILGTDKSIATSWSYYPQPDDSPRKMHLKKKIQDMANKEKLLMKRITYLQKLTSRQKRRIANMTCVIKGLENNGMITHNAREILIDRFGNDKNLFSSLFKKYIMNKNTKQYNEIVRQFAITLHYFSPRAYNYLRTTLKGALPHEKTLARWYKTINAEPGFTSECFDMLQKRNKYLKKNILCSLVFDEMSLRQHVEWVNDKVYGLINIGNNINDENIGYAKEALVFMIVAINESWKVPLGYFFVHALNAEKKADLITKCLQLLQDCKITVTNITFDCCPTNLTTARILGCKFEFKQHLKSDQSKKHSLTLETQITNENPTFIYPDPSHILKLLRNALAELGILLDANNNEINFKYLKKLNELQEQEGLHLCNKITNRHINFFKQKMKVKLASQLLSKSVAEALTFCSEVLKLEDFINAGPTIKFISMINDAFDILNSRKISDYNYKQALCDKNFDKINLFFETLTEYITTLKDRNGTPILNCKRKAGFLCMLVSMKSLLCMYKTFVQDKDNMLFIPAYKMSQDHLELFFGTVRSCGGYNNNPTCRQFISAYKKILIHAEIREHGMGNCVPLQDMNILKCSSNTNNKINVKNTNNNILNKTSKDSEENVTFDHDYVFNYNLSQYSKEIDIYISGFVAKKLSCVINCADCSSAIIGFKEDLENSLLAFKDRRGLTFPSNDLIQICIESEIILLFPLKNFL